MGISRMFLVYAFVAAGACFAAQNASAKDDLLIGYVEISRALVEVNEGKRAKDQLKAQFEKKQKELSDREAKLKKLKDDIDKESIVKVDEATQKKKDEFQAQLVELQQIFMKEQKELQEAELKLTSGITDKMRKIIAEIGEQGGYTLILESSGTRMLFAKPHLDLTNEVIRKYNAKYK
jgi:outer membrane protein